MINLNHIKIFCKVAETGSFTKASKLLNYPKSRISRSIATLEEDLKVQLLRRTTRHTSLTESGRLFYQRVHTHFEQIQNEIQSITDQSHEVSGLLKITAPEDVAQTVVGRIIESYSEKYPQVKIQTLVTNDYLDIAQAEIDIAFRVGKLKDSTLKQRKICDIEIVLVASKEYIKKFGHPKNLSELDGHRILLFQNFNSKTTFGRHSEMIEKNVQLYSDSFPMLLNMVLNNRGIALLPNIFCNTYLESGELIKIIPELKPIRSSLHIIYPPIKKMPEKIRAFIDLAVDNANSLNI